MATYPLTWLADVLEDAGCRVVREGDWQHRGRDGSFDPDSIMLHHDASPPGQTTDGVDVIIDGRPGLDGPLSQLWLSYDGVWHVVAAGRANHAGEGGPWGAVAADQGNRDCIGIETDHTTNEQWSNSQRSEGIRGVAALCRKLGIDTEDEIRRRVLAHKEYAPDRKIDPDPLDMDDARANLWDFMREGGGVLGMTDVEVFSNSKSQTFTGHGDFSTVTLTDDGGLSFLVGPVPAYTLHAALTLRPGGSNPVAVGDVIQCRFVCVIDYDGTKDTVVDVAYPVNEFTVTGGDSFANLSWSNKLGDTGDDDSHKKIRLMIKPPDGKSLTVVKVTARALH